MCNYNIENRVMYQRIILLFWTAILYSTIVYAIRSVHRPKDLCMPRIEVDWAGEKTKKNILYASHLESKQILKKFDWDFLQSRLLPPSPLPHRNDPTQQTSGIELDTLLNKLLDEIKEGKKEYTDVTVLKRLDFNRKEGYGLIVFKCKHHPFVLKLFIERPESFVNPLSKGFQPYFFFFMGGGINRHLMGFTRIKNLEYIRDALKNDPRWAAIIDTPRKWFWLPKNPQWLSIRAYNLDGISEQTIEIPAVYAIVADWIHSTKELSLRSRTSRTLGIKLSRILGNRIDPHMGNFILEDLSHKEEAVTDQMEEDNLLINPKKERIVLIDTEHFPSLVGLASPLEFDGYLSWYLQLMGKFAQEKFFRTKSYRKHIQTHPIPEFLAL